MECISIERCQIWAMSVLYALVNTTVSPTTANDSSCPKVGSLSSKTQHPWHRSVDKKHSYFYAKIDVMCIISFSRKAMFNKKWHFSGGMVDLFFQKAALQKIGSFLDFLNWMCQEHRVLPETHGACVDRVKKNRGIKSKSEIRSFIHLTQGEIAHKSSQSKKKRSLDFPALIWP
jgi:hypothetical protein